MSSSSSSDSSFFSSFFSTFLDSVAAAGADATAAAANFDGSCKRNIKNHKKDYSIGSSKHSNLVCSTHLDVLLDGGCLFEFDIGGGGQCKQILKTVGNAMRCGCKCWIANFQ